MAVGRRGFLATVYAAFSLPVSGCIEGESDDVDDGSPDEEAADGSSGDGDGESGAPAELPYSSFDVVHSDDGSLVAFEMVDHWHFHPIELSVDDDLPVWFRVDLSHQEGPEDVDMDDHDVETEVVAGDAAVVSVDEVEEGLVFHGEETGEADVVFEVVDGSGDVVYETEPVPVEVV